MSSDMPATASDLRALAEQSNAWPFEQAKQIVARLKKKPKDEVLFETGYGPSGLPHIGTFGEVARTTMVRHAFRVLTDDKIRTRLLCFSDDMDGMRKVPDNVPDRAALEPYLQKPLTSVPNPFGGNYASFGDHNNAMLCRFLDTFGFDYEFASATEYYKSGRFDEVLLRAAERCDAIMKVMLPTLGEERQATYSPFLPISPISGRVLYVPMKNVDAKNGTVTFADEDGRDVTLPVTGGHVKLQWKPDFGMRWAALGVDFEMFGKDHQTNAPIYDKICEILGGVAPQHYVYELFLDDKGQKISKSKGNGLTIDEWLRYASPESLSLFMYRDPRAAKRLHFDVIPRNVDDYQQFLDGYPRQDGKQRLSNPVWHIHAGSPPPADMPVTFQLLLTLVSSSNAENSETLWGFIGRYRPGVTPQTHPKLDAMVRYAINYYRDFVAPTKQFREPTESERTALTDLRNALAQLSPDATAEDIQNVVYEVGRREPFLDPVKKGKDGRPGITLDWFNMLYQVLLGQEKGPRFGSFVAVYGVPNAIAMIDAALMRSHKNLEIVEKTAEKVIEKNIADLFDSAELLAGKSFYGPAIHLMMAAREESVKWMLVHCWDFLDQASRTKIFQHNFKHEKSGIFYYLAGQLQALDFAVGALELLKEKESDSKVLEATSTVIKHLPTILGDGPDELAKVIMTSLYTISDASDEIILKGQEALKKSIDASEKLRLNSIYVDFDQMCVVQNEPQALHRNDYDKIRCDVILARFHIEKQAGRNPDKGELYSSFPDWKVDLEKRLADLADRLQKGS